MRFAAVVAFGCVSISMSLLFVDIVFDLRARLYRAGAALLGVAWLIGIGMLIRLAVDVP